MTDTVFHKIMRGEIPAPIVFQDEQLIVINDIQPAAPTHLLVIPRADLPRLSASDGSHTALLGHCLDVARQQMAVRGITDYRLVMNNGAGAGQSVDQLHIHVLAGRPLSWPPG